MGMRLPWRGPSAGVRHMSSWGAPIWSGRGRISAVARHCRPGGTAGILRCAQDDSQSGAFRSPSGWRDQW